MFDFLSASMNEFGSLHDPNDVREKVNIETNWSLMFFDLGSVSKMTQ